MPEKPKETYLNLNQPGAEEEQLESQVAKAQEQLLSLKRQQDAIERQKKELEELSRKQAEFEQGKTDMIEKLTRALGTIERETLDSQRRYEQLTITRESFLEHLGVLESIDPKVWDKAGLGKELTKALGAVDDARAEFGKSRTKISSQPEAAEAVESEGGEAAAATDGGSFGYWFKCGIAFTLPLIIFGVIALVVLLIFFNSGS